MKRLCLRVFILCMCLFFSCTKEIDEDLVTVIIEDNFEDVNNVLLKILEDNPNNTLNWDGNLDNITNWEGLTIENDKLIGLSIENKGVTVLTPMINLLDDLTVLKLKENELISIPNELFDLKKIEQLSLSGTNATIELDDFSPGLFSLVNLKELVLDQFEINQIEGIGALTNLEKLIIENSTLITVSDEIGTLTGLTDVSFKNNQIEAISPKIGELTNIRTLDLSVNKLSSLPIEMANLRTLETLDVTDNLSLEEVPREICNLMFNDTMIFAEGKCIRTDTLYSTLPPESVPAGFPFTIEIRVDALIDSGFGEIGFEIHEVDVADVLNADDVANQVLVFQSETKQFDSGISDLSFEMFAPSISNADLPDVRVYRVRLFNTENATVKTSLEPYQLISLKLIL